MLQGKTNRYIGDILGSSPAAVKKHPERDYEQLGVETRTAAASVAAHKVCALNPVCVRPVVLPADSLGQPQRDLRV